MKQFHQTIFGLLIGLLAAGLILIIAKPNFGEPITLAPAPTVTETSVPEPTKTPVPILAQINGEINTPGIYEMSQNSRLSDLISAAGGLTTNADERYINLALLIRDGDYFFIPSEDQEIPEIARNSPNNFFVGQDDLFQYPININEATQEDLESLPGIGPAKAVDILEYRQMVGSFTALEDLLEISGIGPATLEALSDYLICEP